MKSWFEAIRFDGFLISSLLVLFLRCLGVALGLLFSLLLARKFGADEAGLVFLSITIIGFLSVVSRVGMDNVVLRVSSYSEAGDGVLAKSLILSLSVSSVLSLVLWFFSSEVASALFRKPELSDVLKYMAPSIVGWSCLIMVAMKLQAIRSNVASIAANNIAVNLLMVVFLLFPASVDSVSIAFFYSVAVCVSAVLGLVFVLFKCGLGGLGVKGLRWSQVFASSLPLWLFMIMSQVVQYSGQIFSGIWVEAADIARLSVSHRISMLITLLIVSSNFVLAPKFASLYEKRDVKGIHDLYARVVKIMLLLGGGGAAIVFFSAEFIVRLWGEGFEGGGLLQILVVGQLFNTLAGPSNTLLVMSKNEVAVRNNMLAAGFLTIIFSIFAIKAWGVEGAAFSIAFGTVVQNSLALLSVRKKLGFNPVAFI